jgi:preprotein translocase subunit SecG
MYTFLLVLLFIDSVVLIAAVLLQAGKGGGLAASFGGMTSSSDALLGTRQAGNLLTKSSWWSGALFLAIAFTLSLMTSRTRAPRSILDQSFTPNAAPTAPAPTQGAPAGVPLTPSNPAPAGGKAPANARTNAAPPTGTKTPATKTP